MTSILIVDDEEQIREILFERLIELGYEISLAEDGLSAKSLLQNKKFDLVITDIIMPDIDGLELIRFAKENYPGLKIIAMSAGGQLRNADIYLHPAESLGADRRINKPFDLDDIVSEVENLLKS